MTETEKPKLFRDHAEIDPQIEGLTFDEKKPHDNPYTMVPKSTFKSCETDIWKPNEENRNNKLSKTDGSGKRNDIPPWMKFLMMKTATLLDHPITLIVFTMMTFWALFLDEIRVAAIDDKDVDMPFATISLVFMIAFLIEVLLRCLVEKPPLAEDRYFHSFFFYLDLVASLSMVFEALPVFQGDKCNSEQASKLTFLKELQTSTRLGRILRLFRVVRVIKILSVLRKKAKHEDEEEDEEAKPSRVGKKLNDLIVQKVIIAVLVIMVIFPLLEVSNLQRGWEQRRAIEEGIKLIAKGFPNTALGSEAFKAAVTDYHRRLEYLTGPDEYGLPSYLLFVQFYNTTIFLGKRGHDYVNNAAYSMCFRDVEDDYFNGCPEIINEIRCASLISAAEGDNCDSNTFYPGAPCVARAIWDAAEENKEMARSNIVNTIFIALLLFVFFFLFSGDVTALVVRPIESMIDIVHKLAANPTMEFRNQSKSKYETEAVRIALAKIVGLMQLGFGGAGHEIIAANLSNSDSQGLDLMRRGRKADCAYGFCDIRQFTDTVECLQDQVMLFTNSVGEIVHQGCHKNKGEPNKNIGDAFLIVWRPRVPKGLDSPDYTKLVDGALTSFRKCVREIASSQTLLMVTDVEEVHKKFGRGQYRTRLGFGLHFGWSVEGPVGSPTKIDCSYLSPEVKISDRLEAATKIYSSNILMSGQFYDLLSPHIKVGVRLLDHVTLKGGHKPFRIYGCDRSNLWLKISPRMVEIYGAAAAYEQFSKVFHEGIDAFIKGDWMTATQKFAAAKDFCPEDTPTKLLEEEMQRLTIDPEKPTAPVDWKGYHSSEV